MAKAGVRPNLGSQLSLLWLKTALQDPKLRDYYRIYGADLDKDVLQVARDISSKDFQQYRFAPEAIELLPPPDVASADERLRARTRPQGRNNTLLRPPRLGVGPLAGRFRLLPSPPGSSPCHRLDIGQ